MLAQQSQGEAIWLQHRSRAALGASAQVEAFLNRHEDGADAVVKCIVEAVEELGFRSWAYRIINTAGEAPCWESTGGL